MKRYSLRVLAFLMVAFTVTSCMKDTESLDPLNPVASVSEATMLKFAELGFDVSDLKMQGENYLVEGDIIITPKAFAKMSDSEPVIVAGPNGEQYRTFNLVTGLPRTLVIRGNGLSGQFSTALNNAIASYNAVNMSLSMVRNDNANNADITVGLAGGSAGGVAGFPDGNGDPYPSATIFRSTKRFGTDVLTHVMTHELGHCIGLRHSDWFNRSLSCGQGGSEGQETTGIGAVHIPNTTTGFSAGSVMNSCFSSQSDGQFNADDVDALETLY